MMARWLLSRPELAVVVTLAALGTQLHGLWVVAAVLGAWWVRQEVRTVSRQTKPEPVREIEAAREGRRA